MCSRHCESLKAEFQILDNEKIGNVNMLRDLRPANPFVIQAMTAVTSIFALKAALWSVPLVFTEGAAVAIRTVTCLSFFLRT